MSFWLACIKGVCLRIRGGKLHYRLSECLSSQDAQFAAATAQCCTVRKLISQKEKANPRGSAEQRACQK